MATETVSGDEHVDGVLPAPKPAATHASFGVVVLPPPSHDRTEAGILHPAHRAS